MSAEYTTQPITSCPPISQLQAYGFCCPFAISDEESDAKDCINNLQRYPIIWYRQVSVGEAACGLKKDVIIGAESLGIDRSASRSVVKGASSLIDGMLGFLGTSTKSVDQANVPLKYVGVNAELSVVDTEEYGPVILVQQIPNDDDSSYENDKDDDPPNQAQHNENDRGKQKKLPSKLVPLYKIATISPGYSIFNDSTAGGIKLHGRATSILSSGEELLRFDTLGGKGGNILDDMRNTFFPVKTKPNEHVNAIIEQLNSLVEWNRKRIACDVEKGRVELPKA